MYLQHFTTILLVFLPNSLGQLRLEVCKDPSRYVWDPATCDSRIAVQYASKLLTGPPNHYKHWVYSCIVHMQSDMLNHGLNSTIPNSWLCYILVIAKVIANKKSHNLWVFSPSGGARVRWRARCAARSPIKGGDVGIQECHRSFTPTRFMAEASKPWVLCPKQWGSPKMGDMIWITKKNMKSDYKYL